ncbi:hypothetical protein BCV70DRAFT_228886 [Testicularia cyperi]|uniref:Zf-UBP-domain-containing protein n=1 Tax=Testicularia cyperi TaxID=1882483 RepID=A0A317XEL1_9BASI|nr:hypothetical protein BCV70DRAFT_228886 [Testicularia cyperi]
MQGSADPSHLPFSSLAIRDSDDTYSIHIALLDTVAADTAVATSALPACAVQRAHPTSIFGRLPNTAIVGDHDEACRLQRDLSASVQADKTYGSPIDARFGPLQVDWADRVHSEMSSSTNSNAAEASTSQSHATSSSSVVTSTTALTGAPTTPTTPKKKRVFHARQPQVSVPVAKFEKTDSFEGEGKQPTRSNDAQLVSAGESFQGMEIGASEVAFGIVHLYKDKQEAAASPSSTTLSTALSSESLENQIPDADIGSVVAVLAVPSHLTASDFLAFIEPAVEAVTHLRMIRDMHPNRCMVLIRFRDPQDAEDFHKMFNSQPFNAMDPEEICQVVYLTSLTVSKQTNLPFTYPTLSNSDPWPIKLNSSTSDTASTGSANASYELPTCPVCLERMDSSVTGLMTISCQHTFHCSCLSKWGESRCPVCRYSQSGQRTSSSRHQAHRSQSRRASIDPSTPTLVEHSAADSDLDDDSDEHEASSCAVCQTQQDLWVCLICASVGCGRYKQGHAHRHFDETGHLYSLELETQRVWDYAGDGYVHRLIQNKADGKLVELPSASSAAATPERSRRLPTSTSYASAMSTAGNRESYGHTTGGHGGSASGSGNGIADSDGDVYDRERSRSGAMASSSLAANEKIEAIGLEYSYLLTSQLESQRHFYEEKLEHVQSQLSSLTTQMSVLSNAASQLDALSARCTELKQENATLKREKERSDKKAEKAVELARKLQDEMQAERSISSGLLRRLEKTQENEKTLQAQVQDLGEQVNDLMFFVQARDKVDQEGGEAQGGDLEIKNKPSRRSVFTSNPPSTVLIIMSLNKTLTLNDGNKIPQIGLGTWLSKPGEVANAVEIAIKAGYRHLDLAKIYQNQHEVGEALKKTIPSVVKREDLFITSKLWNNAHAPENVEAAYDDTLKELGIDYLDLYLIHWPVAFAAGSDLVPKTEDGKQTVLDRNTSIVDTWKALIELQKKGRVKSIGVSNFTKENLQVLIDATGVVPAANQIEAHPLLPQDDLVEYCAEKNIHLTAYSPLGNNLSGKTKIVDYPQVQDVAKKLNADPAQVLIAWGVKRGYSVIPKSVTESRIHSNFAQITLSDDDYKKVSSLVEEIGKVRFNVPYTYAPQWDIDVFGEDVEKPATHSVKTQ